MSISFERCFAFSFLFVFGLFVAACASEPNSTDQRFDDACARIGPSENGDTIVVMRDTSSSTKALGIVPGVPGLKNGSVVVGPVNGTSKATGSVYADSDTAVEMRPCPASTLKPNQ